MDNITTLPPSGLFRKTQNSSISVPVEKNFSEAKNHFKKLYREVEVRVTGKHNVLEEDVIHLLLDQLLKSKRQGKGLKKSLHYLIKYY